MKRSICVVALLVVSSSAFGQAQQRVVVTQNAGQNAGPGPVTIGTFAFGGGPGVPVQGQPYSATITNESIQTLADGNRIVQSTSGTVARDSEGRTRQDMNLPSIGNLSAANAPHLVVIQDPVAQTSYTLDLTDKTAQKMPAPPMGPVPPPGAQAAAAGGQAPPAGGNVFYVQSARITASGQMPDLPPPMPLAADGWTEGVDERCARAGHDGGSGVADDGRRVRDGSAHDAHHTGGPNRQRKAHQHRDRGMDLARSQDRGLQQEKRSAHGRDDVSADGHCAIRTGRVFIHSAG